MSGLVDKLTVGYTECQGEWISRQVNYALFILLYEDTEGSHYIT